MTLFLKIFLWFWLAMATIVGVVFLVNWSTQSEPLARQWQTFVGEAMNVNSQTAVQIYENEGVEGLELYLKRLNGRQRINSVGLFDRQGNRIGGSLDVRETGDLFDRGFNSSEPQFHRLPDKTFAASTVNLSDGTKLLYMLELKRFQAPAFFTNRLLLQILAVVLTAGLVCYALASYLTSPIRKLGKATRDIAAGDLSVRVGPELSNRRDELAHLASDFDEMAERIESLIESEKRLTRDISHELRSPLARMKVALELLRGRSNGESDTLITRIDTESDRLNELISQILTLSKLETGSEEFSRSDLNLKSILESLIADADFEARARDRSVETVKIEGLRMIGNEQLVRQAFDNVLRNAVLYTEQGTRVEVSMEREGTEAVVTIEDHGPGVPEEEIDSLFKPFYRIGEARDRKSGGTGLGLAIAQRAVRSHNGSITARNTGNGLAVTIRLPVSEARSASPAVVTTA
ncbi:MAG: HAMP domain-containing protein [Acidobacteria bacterium]|nr:MAG: HAMP domain-containing protein [Acidobacteriota bacterium]REK01747.1 MAG: HAMP domain-containing protein [Acidobacteriota bacterium]REK14703.1 MAG: HAMP domain-containing protein [Acidobacteriota bacterium]REK45418.1 MAG: HAMP domain-containing protein [Acidobacteriota bacterium]